MAGLRERGEQIRQFILLNVEEHPQEIATLTAQQFGITRQAVNKHIRRLVDQNALVATGSTRNRHYEINPLASQDRMYFLEDELEEDIVWQEDVKPLLSELPDNVKAIWYYGFTEMFNNAIDHSAGKNILVRFKKTARSTEIAIHDDGEGIFRKIQRILNLNDESHAVLELAKGKLTTDPENHSGEGIFFASRMFDNFEILSGAVYFSHDRESLEDWISERDKTNSQRSGTSVFMELENSTSRTTKEVYDRFTTDEDYGFTKTVVPVRLAQYGGEKLISRSQAKRLLARIDKFKSVIFDFTDVEAIGQAFADEVFRVFRRQHPEIEIMSVHANQNVQQMIRRAETHDNA